MKPFFFFKPNILNKIKRFFENVSLWELFLPFLRPFVQPTLSGSGSIRSAINTKMWKQLEKEQLE